MVGQDCARYAPTPDRWWGLIFSRYPCRLAHAGITRARSGGECACTRCTRSVGYTVADRTRLWIWVVFLVAALLVPLLALTIRFEIGELFNPC